MKRHKWIPYGDGEEYCKVCGIHRKMKTWKLLMAITGSANHYKYGSQMAYLVNGEWTYIRPKTCSSIIQNNNVQP